MKIIDLSNEPYQSQTVVLDNLDIKITVRFLPTVSMWLMKVDIDGENIIDGVALSCGSVIMQQFNKPFGFIVDDKSTIGIDPFRLEDFSDGRCVLYMLEREEMITLRGYDVK